jgi:SM-20-related protein
MPIINRAPPTGVIATYLNPGWPQDGGGELVLYRDDEELARVTPEAGTFVTFLSQDFPHEVRKGGQDRFSIAGWFRVRPLELSL